MDERKVRELSEQTPRIETGPTRFSGDWSGLFIRGDDCFNYAIHLFGAIAKLPQHCLERAALRGLLRRLIDTNDNETLRAELLESLDKLKEVRDVRA